jgi:hypothetical protein
VISEIGLMLMPEAGSLAQGLKKAIKPVAHQVEA